MKTILASEVTDADRPFVCSRGHADGTVTLYYEGDVVPELEVAVSAPVRYATAQEYRDRFTQAELLAMLASTDPMVNLLVLKVTTAPPEGIDLLSAAVAQGLAYLVSQGILTADRPDVIVA